MNQAIVIAHYYKNLPWYKELEASLEGVRYPVVVVQTGFSTADRAAQHGHDYKFPLLSTSKEFELGALDEVYRQYDEVLLFQDTVYIKNHELFRIVFEEHAGHSVAFNDPYQSYLLKFRRDRLAQMEMPVIRSKEESIYYESKFTQEYAQGEHVHVLFNNFGDTRNFITKHREERMIIENEYLIKYKATFT